MSTKYFITNPQGTLETLVAYRRDSGTDINKDILSILRENGAHNLKDEFGRHASLMNIDPDLYKKWRNKV